jgi:DHA1 family bicyclomycin/chloramphenicol resistance-like MFS transporter
MEPLGHIAGVANSVISSLSTFLSFILATFIGQNYTNTVTPLVLGFFSLGLLSYILVKRVRPVEKEKSELFS